MRLRCVRMCRLSSCRTGLFEVVPQPSFSFITSAVTQQRSFFRGTAASRQPPAVHAMLLTVSAVLARVTRCQPPPRAGHQLPWLRVRPVEGPLMDHLQRRHWPEQPRASSRSGASARRVRSSLCALRRAQRRPRHQGWRPPRPPRCQRHLRSRSRRRPCRRLLAIPPPPLLPPAAAGHAAPLPRALLCGQLGRASPQDAGCCSRQRQRRRRRRPFVTAALPRFLHSRAHSRVQHPHPPPLPRMPPPPPPLPLRCPEIPAAQPPAQ